MPEPKPAPSRSPAPLRRYTPWTNVAKAIAVAAIIAGCLGATGYISSHTFLWPWASRADDVNDEQRLKRQQAFEILGALTMESVADSDALKAVDSMRLPIAQKKRLWADLINETRSTNPADSAAAALVPAPMATATQAQRLKLVWVTLWDTDSEDGDTVRLDSLGYSRTVVLAKQPLTFAIPVSGDGVVTLTGVRDGEGGGITVGLSSGTSSAVLPIMSEGQVIKLKIKVN
jgi:hypothetical protein